MDAVTDVITTTEQMLLEYIECKDSLLNVLNEDIMHNICVQLEIIFRAEKSVEISKLCNLRYTLQGIAGGGKTSLHTSMKSLFGITSIPSTTVERPLTQPLTQPTISVEKFLYKQFMYKQFMKLRQRKDVKLLYKI